MTDGVDVLDVAEVVCGVVVVGGVVVAVVVVGGLARVVGTTVVDVDVDVDPVVCSDCLPVIAVCDVEIT